MKPEYIVTPSQPIIMCSSKAFADMVNIAHNTHIPGKEAMWLGEVIKDGNTYHIDNIKIAPQMKNSGAYVETDETRIPDWLAEHYPNIVDRRKLRIHGHTHPGSTYPSQTDEGLFAQLLRDTDDFHLRIIVNKNQEFTLDLFDKNDNVIWKRLHMYIRIGENKLLKSTGNGKFELITSIADDNISFSNGVLNILQPTTEVDEELKKQVLIPMVTPITTPEQDEEKEKEEEKGETQSLVEIGDKLIDTIKKNPKYRTEKFKEWLMDNYSIYPEDHVDTAELIQSYEEYENEGNLEKIVGEYDKLLDTYGDLNVSKMTDQVRLLITESGFFTDDALKYCAYFSMSLREYVDEAEEIQKKNYSALSKEGVVAS